MVRNENQTTENKSAVDDKKYLDRVQIDFILADSHSTLV